MMNHPDFVKVVEEAVCQNNKKFTRADLECLPKGERDGLIVFWNGWGAWLVRDDFIDSEQSPAVCFVNEESRSILDLQSWPDLVFEFWKERLISEPS